MKATIIPVFNCVVALGIAACGPAEVRTSRNHPNSEEEENMQQEVDTFLDSYLIEFSALEKATSLAYWTASNSGKEEDFKAFAAADLAQKTLHSDPLRFAKIEEFLNHRAQLTPMSARSLEVAELAFKANQLPKELIAKMVNAQSEIEQKFNTYRASFEGKKLTNNDLLDALKIEKDSTRRKGMWEALKQVGEEVAPKLIELAEVRNQAAKTLGYENFWDMQVRLQEHDPGQLEQIFASLEKTIAAPYAAAKADIDREIASKLTISPTEVFAWHYDNPFFQAAPPSDKVDLDDFYKDKPKEEIIEIARRFYQDIGIPCDTVLSRSDVYEREGKDQHAFCITIDRGQDVRTLLNIRSTAEWMDTALHEEGHGVYYIHIDTSLPYNLREAGHIFMTEAVAMLFGALGKNPAWMVTYAGADPSRIQSLQTVILEQRRREQLVFAGWSLVMFYFEKELYRDPRQDLNTLWWDLVERYQKIPRPKGRNEPDWAAKPHFTIAPVYYHNYLLGEVFAAQLRHHFAVMSNHQGPIAALSFNSRKDFGEFLVNKVFAPGMSRPWPDSVIQALGEPLTVRYFADEL
jgi:peptidyl-dipeptidase A